MIKSPLRYPGGKSRAVKFLKDFFPKEFKEYREPFFGGGSVGIYIEQHYNNIRLIGNDLNYELFCFWLSVKDNIDELAANILEIKNTYTDGRELYSDIINRRKSNLSTLQRGIDFFVLNRITFSGVADSGGYSEQSFQKRFTISSIDRLIKAHDVVKDFEFYSNDFEDIISKDGEDVFIFLDPPYHSASKSKLYGKNGDLHMGFDHHKLHEILKNTKHKFLMTYDDSEFIRNLYKDFNKIDWNLQYGMNNFKQKKSAIGKELLISNYPIEKLQLSE